MSRTEEFHGLKIKSYSGPKKKLLRAYRGEDEIGRMSMTENTGIPGEHVIEDVWVHPDHQRTGVGTAMWNEAKRRGFNPVHDEGDQTPAGAAWARKVGR